MRLRTNTRRALVLAALALTTGCADTVVHCGPCPGPGFVHVDAGRQPAGTTVTWCLADLACTSETFGSETPGGGSVDIERHVYFDDLDDSEAMDGERLAVTLRPPASAGRPQTVVRTMAFHEGGGGVCSCSYVTTDPVVFEPTS